MGATALLGPEQPVTLSGAVPAMEGMLKFTPKGRWHISGGRQGRVHGWQLRDGSPEGNARLLSDKNTGSISALAVGPADRWLVTGDNNGGIVLTDLGATPPVATVVQDPGSDWIYAIDFSPTGKAFAVIGRQQLLTIWNILPNGPVPGKPRNLDSATVNLAFSPDGRRLAAGAFTGEPVSALVFDVGRIEDPPLRFPAAESSITDIAFSPDGKRLAVLDGNGVVWAWKLDPARLLEAAKTSVGRKLTPTEKRTFGSPNRGTLGIVE